MPNLMAIINDFSASYLSVLFRVLAFISQLPGFSSPSTNKKVQVVLAAAIAFSMTPILPKVNVVDLFSLEFFILILQQIVIGVSFGFFLKILIEIFSFCGFIISMQSGLSFAATVDPSNGQSLSVISQFYSLLSLLLFFSFDCHLLLMELLFYSFETMPVSMTTFKKLDFSSMWNWSSNIFKFGFIMAMTAIFGLFGAQ